MKPLFRSFGMFVRQIYRDSMLAMSCAATLLAAFFFRFGVPTLEKVLCGYFHKVSILSGYYLLFDLFLSLITPYMFCFASSMVLLSEYDDNLSGYLTVTPVGKRGYIVSRLLFPGILSFLVSVVLVQLFSLTAWKLGMIVLVCLLTSAVSVSVALMLFVFANNRVEGMAMAKLAGLFMLGLPVPFFISSGIQYLFSPLPSFWIAKLCTDGEPLYLIPAVLTSIWWLWILFRRFQRKLL